MGMFSTTSGATSVSITGSVTTSAVSAIPSSSQSVINIHNICNGGAQDAYTVTAGKTFYLMGAVIEDSASLCTIYKNDGTTKVLVLFSPTGGWGISSATPIWVYTAGQIVKVNGTNSKLVNFWGIEQ